MSDELFTEEQTLEAMPSFPATVVAISAISPEGYPITLTLNDPAQGAMKSWIALLQKQGFTAPNPTKVEAAQTAAPTTAKVCPYHGPMKESDKRPGTFYCPKKMTDGSYCKEKG